MEPKNKVPAWEEELDKKFGHIQVFKEWKSRDEMYGGIKVFIRSLLKEEHTASYKEGVKDGETSTKNGVGRYQMGYEDGKKIMLREVIENLDGFAFESDDGHVVKLFIDWDEAKAKLQHELTSEL